MRKIGLDDKDVTFVISCHLKSGLHSFRDDSPKMELNSNEQITVYYLNIYRTLFS